MLDINPSSNNVEASFSGWIVLAFVRCGALNFWRYVETFIKNIGSKVVDRSRTRVVAGAAWFIGLLAFGTSNPNSVDCCLETRKSIC